MNGLSPKFGLKDGKFQFTTGADKARDNLYFLMSFQNVRRIYYSDFTPSLEWIVQKPVSQVLLYKTLILGKLRKVISKYVGGIRVNTMGVVYSYDERKRYEIITEFTYEQEGEQKQLVTFI